jgi:hypothetical protein
MVSNGNGDGETMSDSSSQPNRPDILHIAQAFESPEAAGVENSASQCGFEIERCGDVYVGLARALKNSPIKPVGVVVCVAGMPPEQFEFFELTSRAHDLTVLVYGAQSPERVVRALQAGASGLFSHETMAALGARSKRRSEGLETKEKSAPQSPKAEEKPAEAPPEARRKEVFTGVAPVRDAASQPNWVDHSTEEDSREGRASEVDGGSENSQGVRVPWLRYESGSVRRKPGGVATPQEGPVPSEIEQEKPSNGELEKVCADETHYEPLLTEQELAALLGDDFDEVSAQERELLTGDKEVPGSGTR